MLERKKELQNFVNDDVKYDELINNILFLEDELKKLKELPHIRINPSNNEQQKATPAAKMYKEYLQQYLNALKVLMTAGGELDADGESPLRTWIAQQMKKHEHEKTVEIRSG